MWAAAPQPVFSLAVECGYETPVQGEKSSRVLSRTSEDLYPTGSFCSDTEIDNRLAWLCNITLIKGGSVVQSFVDAYFASAAHIQVLGGSAREL